MPIGAETGPDGSGEKRLGEGQAAPFWVVDAGRLRICWNPPRTSAYVVSYFSLNKLLFGLIVYPDPY